MQKHEKITIIIIENPQDTTASSLPHQEINFSLYALLKAIVPKTNHQYLVLMKVENKMFSHFF